MYFPMYFKQETPVTSKHLNVMHNLFQKENINLRDLKNLNLCFIAYTDLLRLSEVSSFKKSNLDIQDHYMRFFLEQGKMDIYRSGHWICISKVDFALCPVKLFNKYILMPKY